jgi:hypothetical protein
VNANIEEPPYKIVIARIDTIGESAAEKKELRSAGRDTASPTACQMVMALSDTAKTSEIRARGMACSFNGGSGE